jgi:hypothetical protein
MRASLPNIECADAAIRAPQLESLERYKRPDATIECRAHHLEEKPFDDVGGLLVDGDELLARIHRDQLGR